MNSVATRRFWSLFRALPAEVQSLAVKNYHLWRSDPNHPALRFRRLHGGSNRYTIRIGDHYRAVGRMESGSITWVWIGSHSEYNRLVR